MSTLVANTARLFAEDPLQALRQTSFAGVEPQDIVRRALAVARRPVVSTNFRPRSAAFLHLITRIAPDIPVLWVDTGYNTPATYRFAEALTRRLQLNLKVYSPLVTGARRSAVLGGVPALDDPAHRAFTQEVKLEPFERALREHAPDLWLTGIRGEQTDFRRSLGVVSDGPLGTLRVAPIFAWSAVDLEDYLYEHGLPDNDDYVDPTKGRDNRECGLQSMGSGI
ncbi:MAG TPA: phosphoadenosine phosphosulfate reductase family protein [Gammaproteobacteria bacterium]|nr:phosphoadenosine phosphosulfate reductase family protein [Gammaproteobacteria bacterium]